MSRQRKKVSEQDRVLEELILSTKNNIKEISFSYEKLSHILKKMPEYEWSLQEEEILHILGRVSMEACEGCSRFYQCYRKEKQDVLDEVRQMLLEIENGKNGGKIKIPYSFEERCIRTERFFESLLQSYEIIGINRSWKNKMLYQRKVMSSQMEEMSRILFDCSAMMGYDKKGEECFEKVLRKCFRREKVLLSYLRFYENRGKKKEIYLIARTRKGSCPTKKVASILSMVLKIPMVPTKECPIAVYEETAMFHFAEDVNFHVLTGMSQQSKEGENVCGDLFSVLRLEKGKDIFILADGMGSGQAARKEGELLLELVEQLLETGFHEEETLRVANSAITYGVERSRYSSLDLLSLNLFTGVMKVIKAGSAATFLVRKDRVEVIRSRTLPAGFLWELEFDVLYKKLYDGDSVVLVSDGILDCVSGDDPEEECKKWLPSIYGENPQQSADRIMEWALSHTEGNRKDDMSVMVIYLWKKQHVTGQRREKNSESMKKIKKQE